MVKSVVHDDTGLGLNKDGYHAEDAHILPEDTVLVTSEPPSGYY